MKQKIKNTPFGVIFAGIFLLLTVCNVICGGIKYARINSCEKRTLSLSEFTFCSMKETGENSYACTDSDPQMIYTADENVGLLIFEMKSYLYTGDIVVYYTTDENRDFSRKCKTWAHKTGENTYTVDFGGKYINKIRIDPAVYRGDRLVFGDIVLNRDAVVTDYVIPSYYDIFCISIASVMLCAAAGIVKKLF